MKYSVKPEITPEILRQKIGSYNIFKRYCPKFIEVGAKFKSEFRNEEHPSCCIEHIHGDLLYKDFGNGESYRFVSYVMRKYGMQYRESLEKIASDFDIIQSDRSNGDPYFKETRHKLSLAKPLELSEKPITVIRIKRREWNTHDLEYWTEYGWSVEMLEKADIYPISYFWIEKRDTTRRFNVKDKRVYTIDYYRSKGIFRRKIYFVDDKKLRFLSNVDDSIVQGYKLLPRQGDILFITSSIKDCGVFWKLGYNAVAPNNEGSFIPVKFFEKLKKRFKRIIIWYNNDWEKEDNPGVRNAKKYSEEYGIEYYYNPDGEPKDPSDFIKKYGEEDGFNKFANLISKIL